MPTSIYTPAPALVAAHLVPATGQFVQGQPCEGGELVLHVFRFLGQPELAVYIDRMGQLVLDGPGAGRYVLDVYGYLHFLPCCSSPLTDTSGFGDTDPAPISSRQDFSPDDFSDDYA